ncbi:hypothetical protein MTR67_034429 [Solanum verrucosum]|uniref:Uncharacterized protein n=1 Tax=Solanum verrucosum TaxID=315347 RepID=A0AAF0ZLA5_SOLVR|nr:hypothetical protein MTR67_034429 [Solanum verrucosum]
MSVLYHPDKANVVADALSCLSMGSVAHINENVKSKQGLDWKLVEFKETVLGKSIDVFSQGGDGVLHYQGPELVHDDMEKVLCNTSSSKRVEISAFAGCCHS